MIILLTAIIFFFLGRWSIKPPKLTKRPKTIDEMLEKARSKKPKIKAGIIPFKKPEDFTPEGKLDRELEKQWNAIGRMK